MNVVKINVEDFQFESQLSIEPLIAYWKESLNSENLVLAAQAQIVLTAIENTPELRGAILDIDLLKGNHDTLELLMSAVFSPATWEEDIRGVVNPFKTDCFYDTPRFQEIITSYRDLAKGFSEEKSKEAGYLQNIFAYGLILKHCYDKELNISLSLIMPTVDKTTGLIRHFKAQMNPKFVRLSLNGELPELSEDDISEMLNRYQDLAFWCEKLPPHLFEFSGVAIMELMDITEHQMISAIKEELLTEEGLLSDQKFARIQNYFESLIGVKGITIGIASYQGSSDNLVNFGSSANLLFLGEFSCMQDAKNQNHYLSEVYFNRNPLVIPNVQESLLDDRVKQRFEANNLRSVIFLPLIIDGEVIGIFEVGGDRPNVLTSVDILRFQELLAVLAVAVKRNIDQINNQIMKVIKNKFTSLHQAVEWKFEEAAIRYLKDKATNNNAKIEPIDFQDVYPLFGSSDVRDSSEVRNKCIQDDLNTQLSFISEILNKVIAKYPYLIYKELSFEVKSHSDRVSNQLLSEDEVIISDMFHQSIEPLFKHLASVDSSLKIDINRYFDALDVKHGLIYRKRKDYADSVAEINNLVYNLIETEEEKTQKMFPYYFENYKTDGVEYNIYIGQSLTNKRKFNSIYLYNLRLWQLMLMCKITRETHKIMPSLPIPLETAQLILVQSAPLAIKFRIDEKKFDVDGAYNIRYEIMKKRIDKAMIKGTNERITQPGTVAVIYSNRKEEQEYLDYFKYLAHLNYINPVPAQFELEYLQGVSGLKAFRLEVNLSMNEEVEASFQKEMMDVIGEESALGLDAETDLFEGDIAAAV